MAACRSCGKEITFAVGPNGRNMPLQLDAAEGDWVIVSPRTVGGSSTAVHIGEAPRAPEVEQEIRRGRRFTSHFATCPDADKFRNGGI